MSEATATTPIRDRTLSFTRVLDAPRANVYRCWTEPELLKQWFTPKPWTTPHAELDVRAGGSNIVTMRSPEGQEHRYAGVYLEVVPGERLVTTDAYVSAWTPSGKAFMTLSVTLADAGPGKTAYIARVMHWTAEGREQHEQMGFHQGWAAAAAQLEAVAKALPAPDGA